MYHIKLYGHFVPSLGDTTMKITQAQRNEFAERRQIEDKLREEIAKDIEFRKLSGNEQERLLLQASLLWGHNLTGL